MDAGPGRPKPILFLDFEASSLSEESWPIEIGAASIVHGNVRVWSTLIAPRRDWPLDDWREASARVHGIPFEDVKGGADPERVARLTDQFTAYDVISDNPEHDQFWLDRLRGRQRGHIPIRGLRTLIAERLDDEGALAFSEELSQHPAPHRAAGDAARLAEAWLAVIGG